ncbi:MAG TPA: s-methyl-5-thioribose-1-phosphate isomerase [Anaerolineae bacterium]|nr:s-methyl-5-thioribose-1-phosphate isomerase [Anaerolineae bacterium]
MNELLPFLLRRENVARYDDGTVIICDRRKYPFERTFVRCPDVESVACAVEQMVTQGGGPWVAAAYAMVGAARRVDGRSFGEALSQLESARQRLVAARPTHTGLARRLDDFMQQADQVLQVGAPLEATMLRWVEDMRDRYYAQMEVMGSYGADLLEDGDGVLTSCFAESSFVLSLITAERQGKRIHVWAPETRPYLQGARLTAPSLHEMGIPVQVISDNMPAYIMSQGKIQKYFTAADLVTLDGHVVNKIGTFQSAVAAHHHGIPYFVFSVSPDHSKPNAASIVIEERNPSELRTCCGALTTLEEIGAYYPAFDITPPHLVAGIITEHGVLSPYDLVRYYGRSMEKRETQRSVSSVPADCNDAVNGIRVSISSHRRG